LPLNNFESEASYKAALLSESELQGLNKTVNDYDTKTQEFIRDIKRLSEETAGITEPDTETTKKQLEETNANYRSTNAARDTLLKQSNWLQEARQNIAAASAALAAADKISANMQQLSNTANAKLDFETYAQMAYFERVLRAANLRLLRMSQNRYSLCRVSQATDSRKRSGLEMEVLDAYTGKTRPAGSLSGGESFMAALSLALGLSDITQ